MKLHRPFAYVIEALGRPGNQIPAMMPKQLADLPADKPVPETVGSGPFTFDRAAWRPGDRATFRRNPLYKPRDEPADWLAGGKVARVDRVDLVSIPDQATRVAGLQAGELDYLEVLPTDFVDTMRRNHAQPPFDDPAIRRAVPMSINQEKAVQAPAFA